MNKTQYLVIREAPDSKHLNFLKDERRETREMRESGRQERTQTGKRRHKGAMHSGRQERAGDKRDDSGRQPATRDEREDRYTVLWYLERKRPGIQETGDGRRERRERDCDKRRER